MHQILILDMTIDKRINDFAALGTKILSDLRCESALSTVINEAHTHNPWFTPNNIHKSIRAIASQWLSNETLENWVAQYPSHMFAPLKPKTVGVIMAGNIPFVGFHDFLCVLASGNRFLGKTSSKDGGLMRTMGNLLIEINPEYEQYIEFTDGQIKGFDAIIATGSDNTARYFDFYFKNYPSIIRKHRNSIAIITGKETPHDFEQLGFDIFDYFGLGCRNVSKLLVPKNYDFTPMLDSFANWSNLINHNKYANNYEYNRAIYTMNRVAHLDTGYLIVTPSEYIESPVGVIFYQEYSTPQDAMEYINLHTDKIQCVVGNTTTHHNAITFGTTQMPQIDDYADGIDTIKFMAEQL